MRDAGGRGGLLAGLRTSALVIIVPPGGASAHLVVCHAHPSYIAVCLKRAGAPLSFITGIYAAMAFGGAERLPPMSSLPAGLQGISEMLCMRAGSLRASTGRVVGGGRVGVFFSRRPPSRDSLCTQTHPSPLLQTHPFH
jgi:hypothetical protein